MARGDQIYVYREFLNLQGVYEHHGIDCGDGTVIHYRKPSETVERTSFATFSKGNKVYVRKYPTHFIPDVVIKRAESRLGEKKYNLLYNNCEHLATWCKTGVSDSRQIRDFIPIISQMDTEKLSEPIAEAVRGSDREKADKMFNKAIADIKLIWNTLQPQYNQEVQEIKAWQKVAIKALKQNREDLARQALIRKQEYEKSAKEKKVKLDRLAEMTETLVRNRLNLK
ncbi:MAG TPA: NC domain-containing protein [Cyanobacteria bacterium UBA11149]|nr:NC domain-containing protein [Cyanobacteria bacterium UBA11367]HBE61049.1 NC domain-containing protein [Cyanobacteria bacterium UBA11366]HBK62287.1 NC domain-containing protein [Cyanobacteria bacterium UBA11166]HBR74235.1 NC domain-containing protein [Cyanobacteria bacterium UBA11159]HBS69868.1 NC domain-containing protein [Cyanobacteria bacterium UBA11153]HBW91034.1 NC domain-containing protein [Cyanobacteria bacterium UBA11149]HCA95033.1 NC domain-containing protein [Cyanobacteria bacter